MSAFLTRRVISCCLALSLIGLAARADWAPKNIPADKASLGQAGVAGQALPSGVAELRLRDFYKLPVGPRGLEPTEKLLSLKDRQVPVILIMAPLPSFRHGCRNPVPRTVTCRLRKCLKKA